VTIQGGVIDNRPWENQLNNLQFYFSLSAVSCLTRL
jgi:hypothetical protein